VAESRIDLTPTLSPDRHSSGVLQEPGDLTADESDAQDGDSGFGLTDLENLLDRFAEIRPIVNAVAVDVLEQLISDFVALRSA
jgi:hypothetical protein